MTNLSVEVEKQTAVEMRDVCFDYGAEEVLHNVTLRIFEKELIGVVGPNGGGKTTLLRILLGLLTPKWGYIRVFGQSPIHARRECGYVPQHMHFDTRFPVNVLDVTLMGRVDKRMIGFFNRQDRHAALHALERVEMAEYGKKPFSELSGGQRQRVLIAQALVCEPRLLLLDEPTANLDTTSEHHVYDLLKMLSESVTIVLVSHNLRVVTHHVKRVLCVNRTVSFHPADALQTIPSDMPGAGMTLLGHDDTCPVFDPTGSLNTPHRGKHREGEED